MRNKRGQAEDIFSDLIPAIIILVIGIIVIAKVDSTNKLETSKLLSNNLLADRMTGLALLKSPFDVKQANDIGYSGSFVDFINQLRLIRPSDTDLINKLSEAKLGKFFSYSTSTGEVQHGSSAAFQCKENLYWHINEGFLGNYLTWVVRVYEEDANGGNNRLLFICTSDIYAYNDYNNKQESLVEKNNGCFSENSARYDRALLYGQLGGKGNSVDRGDMFSAMITQPTPDKSKIISMFIDYSDSTCPLNPERETVYEIKAETK
ncbi:MAG: hypothetical protein AABY09_04630 [Nanoarchaeota archaeon]